MSLITIKTFTNPYDAMLAKSKLESRGIKCFIFGEDISDPTGFYNLSPAGGIKLQVSSASAEEASKLLKGY